MTRLGIMFTPSLPPESLPTVARAADEHLDDLWVWEDCFKQSGLASAAVALARTDRLRVGIGLMPAPLRAVALTAMEVATLARLFPGRFVPGVGHGVQSWMGQAGVRVESPLTLLREYAVALRQLLAGEEVSVQGRYVQLDGVKLDWPPDPAPLLMSGGQGPKTLALAGKVADGILLAAGVSEDDLERSLRSALAERPADLPAPEVVHALIVATGDGAERRLAAEYAMWDVEAAPGRGVAGDAEAVAAAVRALSARGATTVALQPTTYLDAEGVAALVEFAGREVRPLLA
ncbi:LLM class flavin-dependent oxidoreductase [Knoellia koreensis]|uniref:LLM class flavin-dependent oxidoreductase n=1 Tax=Knoellia koreensis TaxID=2730921 RepID=A0A849HIZ7_9MICO|nr:LLM class flavin-dependent oxidoreductase [Knoellia sp. DB2414S]NNM47915.1 LLM class flavin-dependent oxidoreductase [Knoellia sp. DB2414S]